MNYMNVFFTAQKQNVVLDVCALEQHLSLLQQGCDITNGLYFKVPQLQGLLQYLLVRLNIATKFMNINNIICSGYFCQNPQLGRN